MTSMSGLAAEAYDLTCHHQPCDQYAERVELFPLAEDKIVYHYLIDLALMLPLPSGSLTAVGSPVTSSKNSFSMTYYYQADYSISLHFQDLDLQSNFELSDDGKEIFSFERNGIRGYFYDSSSREDETPEFTAVILVKYGYSERFIIYTTRGLSELNFRGLLGSLKEIE
ncbi:hypothetical protein GCM10025791_41530 [Halioxenophilus aromaticivorans]|uniref:Uncharacterized protein n=2 Tax=Halioxenophilus aromaticivorans TaxID=1306992 RepID=A0AAV3U8J2_9ALTE